MGVSCGKSTVWCLRHGGTYGKITWCGCSIPWHYWCTRLITWETMVSISVSIPGHFQAFCLGFPGYGSFPLASCSQICRRSEAILVTYWYHINNCSISRSVDQMFWTFVLHRLSVMTNSDLSLNFQDIQELTVSHAYYKSTSTARFRVHFIYIYEEYEWSPSHLLPIE